MNEVLQLEALGISFCTLAPKSMTSEKQILLAPHFGVARALPRTLVPAHNITADLEEMLAIPYLCDSDEELY